MFFWVKISAPPDYIGNGSLETAIFERSLSEKVLAIPGGYFKAEGDPEQVGSVADNSTECYFRGTFAAVEEELVVEGIARFGRSIRGEFGLPMDV